MDWLINILKGQSENLSGVSNQLGGIVDNLNSQEFVNNNLIFQWIGTIHYMCGDIIWYEIVGLFSIGLLFFLAQVAWAVIMVIKNIKQTALF